MIPAWVGRWVGLPYRDKGRGPDGFDCWGLVRAALLAERGIRLPDYADAYESASDPDSASRAVTAGLANGWRKVERPEPFDLVILKIALRPWHCGLIVARGWFLHCPPPHRGSTQTLSCLERLDSLQWRNRVEGFYRLQAGIEGATPWHATPSN